MGQAIVRSPSASVKEICSDNSTTINTHNALYARTSTAKSLSTSLQVSGTHASASPRQHIRENSGTLNLNCIENIQFFKLPHAPAMSPTFGNGQQLQNATVDASGRASGRASASKVRSELATMLLRSNYLSFTTDCNSTALSTVEAQQYREAQFLDTILMRAVGEVSTVPTGELEVLASGFLSFSDYVYVAQAVKELSSLLLLENDLAMQNIHAAMRHAGPNSINSPSTAEAAPLEHNADAVRPAAKSISTNELTTLPWALVRNALVAQQRTRFQSISTTSHTKPASSMGSTLFAQQSVTSTAFHAAHTRSSSAADLNESPFRNCSVNEQQSVLPENEVSTQTASSVDNGVTYSTSATYKPSRGPSMCATDATPMNATGTSLPSLGVITNSILAGEAAKQQQQQRLLPSSVTLFPVPYDALAAEPARPLSLGDLVSITTHDEVLNLFLESMTKKMRGLSRKLRALSAFAAFRYCMTTLVFNISVTYESSESSTSGPNQKSGPRSQGTAQRNLEARDGVNGNQKTPVMAEKSKGNEWIISETVVERSPDADERRAAQERDRAFSIMGNSVCSLFADTKGLLLSSITTFAKAMPLGIGSRINNSYLLPTESILADYVSCGVYTRRRKEFFVSMDDRAKMLADSHCFGSPESILLAISQLSNLASQMLSSFAIGAVLAFTVRWRELYEAGITKTDEIADVLEDYATLYCKAYDTLCNEAFPALRKQYPNVFVASSFAIKEENGGRPPMITVAISTLLKLLFLFAGGLESIRADDRRLVAKALQEEQKHREAGQRASAAAANSSRPEVRHPSFKDEHEAPGPTGRHHGPMDGEWVSSSRRSQTSSLGYLSSICNSDEECSTAMTDDVALSTALQVRAASTLVSIGALLAADPLNPQAPTTYEVVRIAHGVSRFWRVLFQTAGLLPHGVACPKEMAKWLPLFPMYVVNSEAKRMLLQVFAKVSSISPLCIGPIHRDDVLHSAADIVAEMMRTSADEHTAANLTGMSSLLPTSKSHRTPSIQTQTQTQAPRSSFNLMHSAEIGSMLHNGIDDGALSTSTAKDRTSVARPSAHATVSTSYRIIPVFVVGAKKPGTTALQMLYGLRSGLKFDQSHLSPMVACELRQDLFDLTARLATEPFLPPIHLSKEVRAIPLPGGVAMFHREKLEDCSAATLTALQKYIDKLAVVVTWRRSVLAVRRGSRMTCTSQDFSITDDFPLHTDPAFDFACPIRAGDEITLRWSDPACGQPAQGQKNRGAQVKDGDAATSIAQRHVVLTVLCTTSPQQYLVVLDAPNYLSAYAVRRSKATNAVPRAAVGQKNSVSGTSAMNRGCSHRRQSCTSVQSVDLSELENAAADAPFIADMLLYRREASALTRDVNRVCAWANVYHVLNNTAAQPPPEQTEAPIDAEQQHWLSALATAADARPELAVPMLLGWLLGQSAGNDVTFTLPLPPLAFRILSLAMNLEEPLEDVHLQPADLSLKNPICTNAELCQHTMESVRKFLQLSMDADESPSEAIHFLGSPSVARRQYYHLKEQLKDILTSMSWNGQTSDEVAARDFWSAVLQGYRQTPLADTPLFAQCCSRTLREVLCGEYDHPDVNFSFRGSFLLLTNLNAPLNPYRSFTQNCVKCVLDEDFSLAEKRLLLRFITGHTLRTNAPHQELISIHVQSVFDSTPEGPKAHLGTAENSSNSTKNNRGAEQKTTPVTRATIDMTLNLLPTANPYKRTVIIPNYFEALMVGSYRESVLGASSPWFNQSGGAGRSPAGCGDDAECNTKESVTLEEKDLLLAWTSLSSNQQETLKRRYRELLVHRIRAALYAFLIGQDDAMEASWDLAEKLGLGCTAAELSEMAGDGLNANSSRGGAAVRSGGTFMRRRDGTVVFVEYDSAVAAEMTEFEELPFDDDEDTESVDGAMAEGDMQLDNSLFAFFGEDNSVETRGSAKGSHVSARSSMFSEAPEAGGSKQSQQPLSVDYSIERSDLHGYHTAASFCFDKNSVSTPVVAAVQKEGEDENTNSGNEIPRDGEPLEASHSTITPEALTASNSTVEETPIYNDSISSLAPMAIAAPRGPSAICPRMSTLERARASRLEWIITSATQSPAHNTSPFQCNTRYPLPPTERPSLYSMSTPSVMMAQVACPVSQSKSTHAALTNKRSQLMDQVDSGIRELFPDDNVTV
ncbi:hypothetical protein ABL78_1177 [Leptomonas seymouri]|uniref:Uncharacterized protein n=1 Tax=Leptomonas seymouri TaxID=5684 RepID=A0A0N1IMF2_LEPSE|nr:hypothetical protein ABL78_1177 [Leptomonas seymouri]|eukprot:KPI89684.1 hypothetical protein ABL78_1177 [Leptomonas seymouri]